MQIWPDERITKSHILFLPIGRNKNKQLIVYTRIKFAMISSMKLWLSYYLDINDSKALNKGVVSDGRLRP